MLFATDCQKPEGFSLLRQGAGVTVQTGQVRYWLGDASSGAGLCFVDTSAKHSPAPEEAVSFSRKNALPRRFTNKLWGSSIFLSLIYFLQSGLPLWPAFLSRQSPLFQSIPALPSNFLRRQPLRDTSDNLPHFLH